MRIFSSSASVTAGRFERRKLFRMHTRLVSLVAAAFALLAAGPASLAQPIEAVTGNPTTRARSSPVFTLYFENDTFTGTDQHYTNGLKFYWLSADLVGWGQTGRRERAVAALPFINRSGGQ